LGAAASNRLRRVGRQMSYTTFCAHARESNAFCMIFTRIRSLFAHSCAFEHTRHNLRVARCGAAEAGEGIARLLAHMA
jgi:hypothetical protein